MPTLFSYWLLPAEPAAAGLQAQIKGLAVRYDAVVFEPHVTLYTGPSDDREVAATLASLRQSFQPLTLVPFVVAQSSRLTKTLYIRLELTSELAALAQAIKGEARHPSDSRLDDPHVSLLYQRIDEKERAKLAAELALPAPFAGDGIAVIETEIPIEDLDQIRRWRFVNRFRHGT
jgi:2'-5' RNA ligase